MATHRKPRLRKFAITSRRSIKDTLKYYHQPCLHRRSRPHGPCGARRHYRRHSPILGGWIVYQRSELDSQLRIPIFRFSYHHSLSLRVLPRLSVAVASRRRRMGMCRLPSTRMDMGMRHKTMGGLGWCKWGGIASSAYVYPWPGCLGGWRCVLNG